VALLLITSLQSVNATVSSSVENGFDTSLPGYNLVGPAPASQIILVNIALPLRNTDKLSSYANSISDPSSPLFGHFLSMEQIRKDFLPTAAYQSMLTYLSDCRLQVVSKALDSMIVVQATVGQIKQYLHKDVNLYSNGTSSYYMTKGSGLNGAQIIATNSSALLAKPLYTIATSALNADQSDATVTYMQGGISAAALPEVYNATTLYKQGFQGEGQIIGILDFFGSPTIESDLALFCERFNYPQAELNIIPIAPYNPNLGAASGWSTEVALDVELAHAMAPKATIDLYVTNGAMSVAADIAQIISMGRASILSMSLSFASEYDYSFGGGTWFLFNMLLPNQYFMLGSILGMTFLCASGDAGGSGYSSGPAGNSCFPSDSPYVTSVGGTQTYLYTATNGSVCSVQTGWSNQAFVPDKFNGGGSGGGVSFLQPKPWYQNKQQTPPTYPYGRMEPDLSLQAGIYPGIFVVDGGSTYIVGGTSASAPLLAGFLALICESLNSPVGLINPSLYYLGNNASLYSRAFTPITFGYNIPWTASYGYNLVTGWGAPNIGQIAEYYKTLTVPANLAVSLSVVDETGAEALEVTPGQILTIEAFIDDGSKIITNGNFSAQIVTLAGTTIATPMTYSNLTQSWVSQIVMGQLCGVAYVDVVGSSSGLIGEGIWEFFAGYIATFYYPYPTMPWTTSGDGLPVVLVSTDLFDNLAPLNQSVSMKLNSYSILRNRFSTVDLIPLFVANNSQLGQVFAATLSSAYSSGPLAIILQGSTYGFLPFMNGIYLQSTIMYPEVAAEPGCLAPGQSLTIACVPKAPLNIADMFSYDSGGTIGTDITTGCSVTAYLINPAGASVASADLVYQNSKLRGTLPVPLNAVQGLYTVYLVGGYESGTLGVDLFGSFFGQVWVSSGIVTPKITLMPTTLYMGQTAKIIADIRYPDGKEVTQGIYSAIVYPQQLQNQYAYITGQQSTSLNYNSELDRWVADVTLPSPINAGVVSSIQDSVSSYFGVYEAYVTGLSFDGFPTTTQLNSQQSFLIQPYLYIANQTFSGSMQTWDLALSGITLTKSVELSECILLDSNYVQSTNLSLVDCKVDGILIVNNANLTLRGVNGGNIVATNSSLRLLNSDVTSLSLANSSLTLSSSTFGAITPAIPKIQIDSPINGGFYKGDLNITAVVSGNDVSSVTFKLNNQVIKTLNANGSLSYNLLTQNYVDGTYLLEVIATQSNGLNTSQSSSFSLNNGVTQIQANINSLSNIDLALQSQLNNLAQSTNTKQTSLDSKQTHLQTQLNNLTDTLNRINQSKPNATDQIGTLNNSLNSTLQEMSTQILDLQNDLKDMEQIAIASLLIAFVGVAVAIFVALKKRSVKKM
jgi:subtilase family serine protease